MPKIPPQTLKSTFYLYPTIEDAETGASFGGTGFLVGRTLEGVPGRCLVYAVTNWHVAVQGSPIIRINRKDGSAHIFDVGCEDWRFPSNGYDIAVLPIQIDQKAHDVNLIMMEMFLDQAKMAEVTLGPGEDVFMAGRFVDADSGYPTNKPAVRFGNISLMPVPIKQKNGATRESFCIDMHSRSGFSGSPVFVYRRAGSDLTTGNLNLSDQWLFLLGIHWGQFPEVWEIVPTLSGTHKVRADGSPESQVAIDGKGVQGMSGMTCVAPSWAIADFIRTDPKLVEVYERAIQHSKLALLSEAPVEVDFQAPPNT